MSSRHSKPTQAAQILAALQAGQSLTPKDARQLYGCDRLGARIFQLRRAGHPIHSRRVAVGHHKNVSEYFLPLEALAEDPSEPIKEAVA